MRVNEILQLLVTQRENPGFNLDLDRQYKEGRSVLHFCCVLGNLQGVKLLIEGGARADIRDKNGLTAMEDATLSKDCIESILKSRLERNF